MMPFDNKNEFQVVIDMPEGTALETTARVASAMASAVLDDETVVSVQHYVGVSAPYNFNGLVRHYFLRRAPHLADLQVNLVPKGERPAQSHDVAGRVRQRLVPIAKQFGATVQVAEAPPGPPVLQTLVAEVYGPDPARRMAVAAQIKSIFEQTPGVVDIDWLVEAPHPRSRSPSMRKRPRLLASRRRRSRRSCGWPVRENRRACCTTNGRARTCRS